MENEKSFIKGAATENEPIKIGSLHCRTGFMASLGEATYRSTVLAFEQINYKVAGRPITLIAEDIASDPTISMDKARKLIDTDKVDLITGITYIVLPLMLSDLTLPE
jgi:ABC-type branched-subunit amino acid transport system substrate-binding protein